MDFMIHLELRETFTFNSWILTSIMSLWTLHVHGPPNQTGWEAPHPRTNTFPLQLGSGFPHRQTPDSQSWYLDIRHKDGEHRNPPGLHPGLSTNLLSNFYRCTVERILTNSITVWFGNCTVQEKKALQRVIKTAQYICGAAFPSLQDIYNARDTKRAHNNMTVWSPGLFVLGSLNY